MVEKIIIRKQGNFLTTLKCDGFCNYGRRSNRKLEIVNKMSYNVTLHINYLDYY